MTQVVAKTVSPKKVKMFQELKKLAAEYKTIAVSNLNKVRASQLMELRKNFRGQLRVIVAKNRIAALALKDSGLKNAGDFIKALEYQNAFIYTNMNPFKLQLILDKGKVVLPARAGDTATDEITVPAGNTGMAPGPVISEFKDAKVPTKIDAGSIWVTEDTIVAEKGDVISPKLAGLLTRLNIKAIKAGMSVALAYSEGLIFKEQDLRLDIESFLRDLGESQGTAVALAVAADYPTAETLPLMLSKAVQEARQLSLAGGYLTKETAAQILARKNLEAEGLLQATRNKGYS